jgi:hypothetical protein
LILHCITPRGVFFIRQLNKNRRVHLEAQEFASYADQIEKKEGPHPWVLQ